MCRTYLTYLQNTCKPGGAGENDLFFLFYGSNYVQLRNIFVVSPPSHKTPMDIRFS